MGSHHIMAKCFSFSSGKMIKTVSLFHIGVENKSYGWAHAFNRSTTWDVGQALLEISLVYIPSSKTEQAKLYRESTSIKKIK